MKTHEEFTACVFKKAEIRLLEEKKARQKRRKKIKYFGTMAATLVIGIGLFSAYHTGDFNKTDDFNVLEENQNPTSYSMNFKCELPENAYLGKASSKGEIVIKVKEFTRNEKSAKETPINAISTKKTSINESKWSKTIEGEDETDNFFKWFYSIDSEKIFYTEKELKESENFRDVYLKITEIYKEKGRPKEITNWYVLSSKEDMEKGVKND